ncbi:MAG: hypothetical protein ACJAXH_002835 [Colwellia sp.]|jgi:hypothetical protein
MNQMYLTQENYLMDNSSELSYIRLVNCLIIFLLNFLTKNFIKIRALTV